MINALLSERDVFREDTKYLTTLKTRDELQNSTIINQLKEKMKRQEERIKQQQERLEEMAQQILQMDKDKKLEKEEKEKIRKTL